MGKQRGGVTVAVAAALVALVLTSCGVGETKAATDITDVSAVLHGVVHNSTPEATDHWFEYGLTTTYDHSTPHASVTLTTGNPTRAVDATISGLQEGTTYHYRHCAKGSDSGAVCGSDLTVTTSSGRDSVTGTGIVLDLGAVGYVLGAQVSATSGPAGAPPVSGTGVISPGTVYFKIPDTGTVTCLRVEGNRAAVGIMVTPVDLGQGGDLTPFPRLVFIEDNGPTGDRFGLGSIDQPATTCPVPAADNFPPFAVGGFDVPPVVTSGDFAVHDHV